MDPKALLALFSRECVAQEVSTDRFVEIPEEVREVYRLWLPTPCFRALNLGRRLQTPARIHYKYEGTSPTGSHKPNTAVAQAYYHKIEGTRRLTTDTGAGQNGAALFPSPVECSASSAPYTWCASPTSKNPIDGS